MMPSEWHDWHDFYMLLGTASAALVALLWQVAGRARIPGLRHGGSKTARF